MVRRSEAWHLLMIPLRGDRWRPPLRATPSQFLGSARPASRRDSVAGGGGRSRTNSRISAASAKPTPPSSPRDPRQPIHPTRSASGAPPPAAPTCRRCLSGRRASRTFGREPVRHQLERSDEGEGRPCADDQARQARPSPRWWRWRRARCRAPRRDGGGQRAVRPEAIHGQPDGDLQQRVGVEKERRDAPSSPAPTWNSRRRSGATMPGTTC